MHDVVLIGAGRIGRIHANNVLFEPRLRLRYVVDPVADAASALAAATGSEVTSLDVALGDPHTKGVIIASSTDTHLAFSVAALAAGKAVFCEKPIDLDLARARSAADRLGAADVKLFMGFNRRFDPSFADLRRRLAAGQMGTLETLHIFSHDPAPPPIDYVSASGGIFRDMTIHDFDMARWLLGEEPIELYAAAGALIDPQIESAGDFDTAKLLLRTATGRICLISNTRRSAYGYDQRIEAFCSNGLIRAGNIAVSTVETWSERGPQHAPFQNFFLDRYADAYRAEMHHFADVLEEKASPLARYDDAVAALALADAAERSARTREPVMIG
jgi:myo-inositol 2-dehydrogenase / D-chiro-inositol 1-dehydrogenase